jgi:hypothetical protein
MRRTEQATFEERGDACSNREKNEFKKKYALHKGSRLAPSAIDHNRVFQRDGFQIQSQGIFRLSGAGNRDLSAIMLDSIFYALLPVGVVFHWATISLGPANEDRMPSIT